MLDCITCENMHHTHDMKRTHITIVETSDTSLRGIVTNKSQGRRLEYDFEFCTECDNFRELDGQTILKGASAYLDQLVSLGNRCSDQVTDTMQRSDFEATKREIEEAIELSKKYS